MHISVQKQGSLYEVALEGKETLVALTNQVEKRASMQGSLRKGNILSLVLLKLELFNLIRLALSEHTVVSDRTVFLEEETTDGFDKLLFKF